MDFLHTTLYYKKQVLNTSEVYIIKAPHYREFKLVIMLKNWKHDGLVVAHLPD